MLNFREGELRRAKPARSNLPESRDSIPPGGVVMDIINKMNNVKL